jgi:hypothetical protein
MEIADITALWNLQLLVAEIEIATDDGFSLNAETA